MCVGFLSLSLEILWMRYAGFSGQTIPWAFSFVLMIYLVGIARGAMVGKSYCESTGRLYTVAGTALLISGVLDVIGPFVAAIRGLHFSIILFIYSCSFLKSISFPIVHHLGSSLNSGKVGKSISRVYFLNIIGSSLGPLITGFWLLDHVSLQAAMAIMGILTCLLGLVCFIRENRGGRVALAGCVVIMLVAGSLMQKDRLTSMLACYPEEDGGLHRIIETKSGIIHTSTSKTGGDYTYGGNVYDGRANISPRVNSNILERVFVLAALRPQPENVLVIGMSSGAWVRILAGFPGVKHIDVVEINPGYLRLLQDYPEISPFLKDPRVQVHIDDGRRWLKRHPDGKFDMIVINTTYHWRSYSTNLLSQEFLRLAQRHMTAGALIAYNTTNSPDVLKTAESVFPYAFGYTNFVIASDRDFRPLEKTGRAQLLRIKLDNKPVFDPNNAQDMSFLNKTLSIPFRTSVDQIATLHRKGEIITDWNMITEYKHGRPMSLFCK
jgi:spermidine synthase